MTAWRENSTIAPSLEERISQDIKNLKDSLNAHKKSIDRETLSHNIESDHWCRHKGCSTKAT